MPKDWVVGLLLLIGGLGGIIAYGWLLFLSEWSIFALKVTAFLALAALLGVLSWIGYTLATTPPPAHMEEPREESPEREQEPVEN